MFSDERGWSGQVRKGRRKIEKGVSGSVFAAG